ncbi:MAG TPA: leucyl/phenylalanyl-tRNA--protein transferase [Candidatus Hydrogenedentes bacterium]|nr:leucyl/phenylalanyl-tRNA--protein transferase [Candidatus Hydrogenedentota bacterium]
MTLYRLSLRSLRFPPAEHADADGLLAVGGDLRTERLLEAYRNGIFPWYSEDTPILWWSPDPRMVFFPGRVRVSRRLARTLRPGRFEVSADTDFAGVIRRCAETPREGQDGTWILPEMAAAYTRLHEEGHAHSVECRENGVLVGGLYGVSIGGCFFAESMFHLARDASKAALAALSALCLRRGHTLIDAQMPTAHLASMGGVVMPRREYLDRVRAAVARPDTSDPWAVPPDWRAAACELREGTGPAAFPA